MLGAEGGRHSAVAIGAHRFKSRDDSLKQRQDLGGTACDTRREGGDHPPLLAKMQVIAKLQSH